MLPALFRRFLALVVSIFRVCWARGILLSCGMAPMCSSQSVLFIDCLRRSFMSEKGSLDCDCDVYKSVRGCTQNIMTE